MADKSQFENLDKGYHGKLIEFMADGYRSLEISGRTVIQTKDGEFIDYVLMDETFFVENWLSQFAIGHVGSKNYFNHTAWSSITDGFTKGVIVLNAEKQPVCLIRKFIDMDLNADQQHYMTQYARKASQAKFIPETQEANQLINEFANAVDIITGQNPDYDTLTAMIPLDYYLKHNVDPEVLKQVIYIRDNFAVNGEPIDPQSDLIKDIEVILYKHARGEGTTKAERDLVSSVTNGNFVFDENTNTVEDGKQEPEDTSKAFDPLAD